MRKPIHLAVALASIASMAGITPSQASSLGSFDNPFSENGDFNNAPPNTLEEAGRYPTAVSIAVLPDGKIVYWDGLTDIQDSPGPAVVLADYNQGDRTRVLDIGADHNSAPIITEPANNPTGGGDNLFCSDQRLTTDGRVIATGGTKDVNSINFEGTPLEGQVTGTDGQTYSGMGTELFGSKHTRSFTTANGGTWKREGGMRWLRWYPTLLTMPDGDLFVAGGVSKLLYNTSAHRIDDSEYQGYDTLPRNVAETEVFDLETSTWSDNPDTASKSLPLFARLHMVPSGEVAFLANGQQFNPFGQDVDKMSWNNQAMYDPASKSWSDLGLGVLGARSGAADVMMRLEPDTNGDYSEAKVLMAGGTLGVSPGAYVATPLTEIVTLSNSDPSDAGWEATTELGPNLNNPRWFSAAVNLPNGDVIVANGGNLDDVIAPGTAKGVRQLELFDGEQWIPLGDAARDRVYHNSAILLKDGSILLGGHSPINQGYGGASTNADDLSGDMVASNLRDPSFQRYYPPYLSAGPRPEIDTISASEASAGDVVELGLSGAATSEVVLSRLPAQTHVTDADARTIKLDATISGATASFEIPGNTVVPPGYYYVFANSDLGVPSVAKIINVTP
jgi:hypothetical protein